MVMLPSSADEARELAICGVFASRIRLRTADVTIISSQAGTRPFPPLRSTNCWERTARRLVES